MNLGKTLLFGTVLAAGAGLAVSQEAQAAESYTVKSGDTLSTISQQFAGNNSLVNTIAAANGISNVNMIYAGQTLTIDANGSTASTTASTSTASTASTESTSSAASTTAAATTSSATGSDAAAKEWIAQKESGGSYTAQNGQYYGRYQLTSSYLNGDYSAANQEAVANNYVTSRYGSWSGAKAFWQANGWY